MRIPKPPFFELGPKNYIYGDAVLELAMAADRAAIQYDVDIIFTTPFADIRRVAENTKRIFVFAPHMDSIEPGRGISKILPESVRAAGAVGVMLNHAEHPLDYRALQVTVKRAHELGMLTAVCADSVAEAKAVAALHPMVIVAEPSELIGTGKTSDAGYIKESTAAIKAVDSNVLVLQAAGVSTAEDVYRNIEAGADATGTTSGVVKAAEPIKTLDQMICALRKAYDHREKGGFYYEDA